MTAKNVCQYIQNKIAGFSEALKYTRFQTETNLKESAFKMNN